ncbi:GNAT family N-acetyltransferase [Allosaccharopolyspora coralli]|nr:GNAT family N-acetyltransferase [Allosaccharopolyspora coralli]
MNRSWRALSEVPVDGWIVRRSEGVTQRANSVLPVAAPRDLPDAITRVERLYLDHGLPPCFQLSPAAQPPELDEVLAERGYELSGATTIQVAEVEEVLNRLSCGRSSVEVRDEPGDDWMRLWWAVDGRGDDDARVTAGRILAGGPALYAVSRHEGSPAAVGRLSLVGQWAGVYCMAVRADVRRRGHAQDILRGLLTAAADRGVRHTWLQVVSDNLAARKLYEHAGYQDFSTYHYRVRRH